MLMTSLSKSAATVHGVLAVMCFAMFAVSSYDDIVAKPHLRQGPIINLTVSMAFFLMFCNLYAADDMYKTDLKDKKPLIKQIAIEYCAKTGLQKEQKAGSK